MKVIALVGKLRAGKDTAFSLLKNQYPSIVYRFSFADQMKKEAGEALGYSEEEFKKILEADKELFRPYLQWYGTDYKQVYQKDRYIWARHLDEVLQKAKLPDNAIVVVTDLRFKHELEILQKNYDTTVIRIERRTILKKIYDTVKQKFIKSHRSETELDDLVCPTVYNTGSKQDLLNRILKVIPIE